MIKLFVLPVNSLVRISSRFFPNASASRRHQPDMGLDLAGQIRLRGRHGVLLAKALGLERPRVGLLNIGSEDTKGDALRQETAVAGSSCMSMTWEAPATVTVPGSPPHWLPRQGQAEQEPGDFPPLPGGH